MKLLLHIAYLVLVAAGAVAIAMRSGQRFEFTASRLLLKNHRLLTSDVREPDSSWALAPSLPQASKYVGRYLDRNIEAGRPIKMNYLKPLPAVTSDPKTAPFPWLLKDADQHWLGVLDVGWTVDLCAETCPVMNAPILAVNCNSPTSGQCMVVLQLTGDQQSKLLEYPGKNKLSLAVSRADSGGLK
jgi:hypothetical protein